MAVPPPELPPEGSACLYAEINSCSQCHEDGSILHTSDVPYGQLNQRLAALPFPLYSAAHDEPPYGWSQRCKVAAALWAWDWSCCCCTDLSVGVYEELPALFSINENLGHEKLASILAFREKVKTATNGVSDATLTPCFKLSPGLPALRPASIRANDQPSSWVGPGNPITTC